MGTATPPIAATTGIAKRLRSRNSPRSSSRFASKPTTKKKSVMSPSLTHSRSEADSSPPPKRITNFVVHTDSYECDHGEFAHRSATTAAPSITNAPPVSVVRKSRTGAARFRAHAVRPAKGVAGASTLTKRLSQSPSRGHHRRSPLCPDP